MNAATRAATPSRQRPPGHCRTFATSRCWRRSLVGPCPRRTLTAADTNHAVAEAAERDADPFSRSLQRVAEFVLVEDGLEDQPENVPGRADGDRRDQDPTERELKDPVEDPLLVGRHHSSQVARRSLFPADQHDAKRNRSPYPPARQPSYKRPRTARGGAVAIYSAREWTPRPRRGTPHEESHQLSTSRPVARLRRGWRRRFNRRRPTRGRSWPAQRDARSAGVPKCDHGGCLSGRRVHLCHGHHQELRQRAAAHHVSQRAQPVLGNLGWHLQQHQEPEEGRRALVVHVGVRL